MKKFIISLTMIILIVASITIPVSAESAGYSIKSYDVNIKVNENNSFTITEEISAFFSAQRHGIFRTLPTKNYVTRLDGSKAVTHAKINDFEVLEPAGVPFTYSSEGVNEKYKIGYPYAYADKNTTYKIRYNYDLGEDNNKKFDELYYNIIGSEWDTTISNVTFTIEMPKDFDKDKLGFSYGSVGSTNSSGVKYSVNGNIITGKLNGNLSPGQALTVRLELPEGYFTGERQNFNFYIILEIIFGIAILVALLLWVLYGRDKKIYPSVEFYPPYGYNSAEVALWLNGKVKNTDIVSLIVYLAHKGYLKIHETEEPGVFSTKQSFRLIKVKDYDGNNEVERLIFNKLFSCRDTVTPSDLTNRFYSTVNTAMRMMQTSQARNLIFEKKSKTAKVVIMIMAIAVLIITLIPVFIESEMEFAILLPIIFPVAGLWLIFSSIKNIKRNFMTFIFGLGWTVISLIVIIPIFIMIPLNLDPNLIQYTIVGVVSTVILLFFGAIALKRTDLGNKVLEKILGFKNFLNVAEKDRINMLVEQDPQYFYNILPFVYVLGITDKWIKQFESIITAPPDWYESSSGAFSAYAFSQSFNSVMNSVASSATSAPSSSGGGGSSGGGSSGGGSGGGGGGSW